MIDYLSNPIAQYRSKLFECQVKAVRQEHPEFSESQVIERATMLHDRIVKAENERETLKEKNKTLKQ